MPSLPSRASPASRYAIDHEFLQSPPMVPAHHGLTLSLSPSMVGAPSPITSSRSSSSAGSPQMLPNSVLSISSRTGALASGFTGNIGFDHRTTHLPRRNSITPYPMPHYEGTRSRFGGQPPVVGSSPPYDITGLRQGTQNTTHVGPERSIKSHRRPSQTMQDENFPPATGAPVRRWKANQEGPAHYELVRAGMFQNTQMHSGMTAVRFFAKGSPEPGVQVASLVSSMPVVVAGDWMFEGIADRELNVELSWPGIAYTAKRRLNIANLKNTLSPYNVLAETLAGYVMDFARQAENYPVHPNYEHLRLTAKGVNSTIDPRQIIIGGLYHCASSKWEIQMWVPKRRQM